MDIKAAEQPTAVGTAVGGLRLRVSFWDAGKVLYLDFGSGTHVCFFCKFMET